MSNLFRIVIELLKFQTVVVKKESNRPTNVGKTTKIRNIIQFYYKNAARNESLFYNSDTLPVILPMTTHHECESIITKQLRTKFKQTWKY